MCERELGLERKEGERAHLSLGSGRVEFEGRKVRLRWELERNERFAFESEHSLSSLSLSLPISLTLPLVKP